MDSSRGSSLIVLTRFIHANRYPLRLKTLQRGEMRILIAKIAFVAVAALSAPSTGLAQVAVPPPSTAPAVDCVPAGNTSPTSPRADRPTTGETMSDKLAQSKGVICPPGGDSEIRVTPPDPGGRMRVIPPQVEPQPPK
jgi:hypothetical protein